MKLKNENKNNKEKGNNKENRKICIKNNQHGTIICNTIITITTIIKLISTTTITTKWKLKINIWNGMVWFMAHT